MSLNIVYESKRANMVAKHYDLGQGALSFGPHLHEDLELVYLFQGKTTARVDTYDYNLEADSLLLVFPNQIHSYKTLEQEDYDIFIFSPSLLPEFESIFSCSLPKSAMLTQVSKRNPQIILYMKLLVESANQSSSYQKHLSRGILLALISSVLNELPVAGLPKEDNNTVRKIIFYCSNHFAETLTLTSISTALHMNKYYISHLFSEKLGIHFTDYVNSLRVSEAGRYLLNSDHTVTEISTIVGFETLRTFNRAFMKQTGLSPTDFRKRNAKLKETH